MGRLFDAVASVLGVRHSVSYEAQAAIELEALSRGVTPDRAYQFGFLNEDPVRIVAAPVWHEILEDLRMGVAPARISACFHGGVAEMVREICGRVRKATGVAHIGLTGGVFQNVLLLEHCRRALEADGFRVHAHRVVPPNDGGLALGQAWLGRR
jgi:hydrogenase maturation protein HypF